MKHSKKMDKQFNLKRSMGFQLKTASLLLPAYQSYKKMAMYPTSPPAHWQESCVNSECTLHQLSPYIGKLKSSIAHDLITSYSKPGDLVVDPFSGSGTVPLEAALLNRNVFAADISSYSKVLTRAKLTSPPTLGDALDIAELTLREMEKLPDVDLMGVPKWVKDFFHPMTLNEAIRFASVCRNNKNDFLMACFLGILHHERPGFLSFPSSHLVPYLRDKKYSPHQFPEMYEYRPLRPRLIAKIRRAYRRKNAFNPDTEWTFRQSKIENLTFPGAFNCLITSPPYMNTLDYGRDNRLRLWFIDPMGRKPTDNPATREKGAFHYAIACMAKKVEQNLKPNGCCILIVGERINRAKTTHLSEDICRIMAEKSPSLHLESIVEDDIPDVRRSRKNCVATKTEHIMVFRRRRSA